MKSELKFDYQSAVLFIILGILMKDDSLTLGIACLAVAFIHIYSFFKGIIK